MNLYLFCLALGVVGLGVMALGGVGHQSHNGHHGHDAAHGSHGGAHHGHHGPPGADGLLWTLAAPRVVFSVLLGFGAAGLLLRDALAGAALPVAALLLGLAFERFVVRRVMNALLGFASAPALTLDSTLFDEARAASGFDANGEGLVAVDVDGQVVQVLGRLRPEDRALGVRVRGGDRLRIEDVDSERHRCTVSFLGRP